MQEVSGSIPLSSTKFRLTATPVSKTGSSNRVLKVRRFVPFV